MCVVRLQSCDNSARRHDCATKDPSACLGHAFARVSTAIRAVFGAATATGTAKRLSAVVRTLAAWMFTHSSRDRESDGQKLNRKLCGRAFLPVTA